VLAKIAEMQEPDRIMAECVHAVITASAPALEPKLWYGMPAYAAGFAITKITTEVEARIGALVKQAVS
jgi:hypothetical protein